MRPGIACVISGKVGMRPLRVLMLLALSATGLAAAAETPQSGGGPSLADIARKSKAERAKADKVFTNDNLPARPRGEGLTAASGISSKPAEQPASKTGTATSSQIPSSDAHDEKYYQAKMKELGENLEMHQRQLDVLEQKLSQNQMQFYSDPNKTLQQGSTPSFNGDVNKLRADIEKKKQQIADDQKAMEDLRDQLRREGGDPGWLR